MDWLSSILLPLKSDNMQRRAETGFTLVEVMISLIVLSLILLLTVTALRTLADTHTRVDHVVERFSSIRQVSGFLRRSIGQSQPVPSAHEVNGLKANTTHFFSDGQSLEWVSPQFVGLNNGGLFISRVSNNGSDLVLQQIPYRADVKEGDLDGSETHLLLSDVQSLNVEFKVSFEGEWLAEWEAQSANPVLVKVEVLSAGRYWPEIIIRPTMAAM